MTVLPNKETLHIIYTNFTTVDDIKTYYANLTSNELLHVLNILAKDTLKIKRNNPELSSLIELQQKIKFVFATVKELYHNC